MPCTTSARSRRSEEMDRKAVAEAVDKENELLPQLLTLAHS